MIKITLDDAQALAQLQSIARQLREPKRLYGKLGEALKKIHDRRFEEQKAPDGTTWKALSPVTLELKRKRGKSNKILRQDGYLANRTAFNVRDNGVEFGSAEPYARLHQFGGQAGRGRKVTIPKRPWLGTNRRDDAYLLQKATDHLRRMMKQNR